MTFRTEDVMLPPVNTKRLHIRIGPLVERVGVSVYCGIVLRCRECAGHTFRAEGNALFTLPLESRAAGWMSTQCLHCASHRTQPVDLETHHELSVAYERDGLRGMSELLGSRILRV